MIAGAICLVFGILLIEALRTGLLIEEMGIKHGVPSIYGANVFLTFQENLKQTIRAMSFADRQLSIIVPGFIAVILGLIVRVAATRPTVFLGVALVYLVKIVAIMIFGLIFETRIFLEFIPFLSVATVLLMKTESEIVMPTVRRNRQGIAVNPHLPDVESKPSAKIDAAPTS